MENLLQWCIKRHQRSNATTADIFGYGINNNETIQHLTNDVSHAFDKLATATISKNKAMEELVASNYKLAQTISVITNDNEKFLGIIQNLTVSKPKPQNKPKLILMVTARHMAIMLDRDTLEGSKGNKTKTDERQGAPAGERNRKINWSISYLNFYPWLFHHST